MSTQIDDGGPAFPCAGSSGGMSLRDYFAAAAIQGLCASTSHDDAPAVKTLAEWAYQQADAMLNHREKTGGSL